MNNWATAIALWLPPMPDRRLDSLSSEFRPKVDRVLARLTEAGVPVLIVCTGRTLEEQRIALTNGTSRTALSKHLPRSLRGWLSGPDLQKSDAIDLCPFDLFNLHGPDKLAWIEHATKESTRTWALIGEIGESEGLRWGGRWTDPHDPGHLEYVFPPITEGLV